MPESIRVERLCKVYRSRDGTEVEALHEVSFTVRRGEFVSIVGQSGCGKSTFRTPDLCGKSTGPCVGVHINLTIFS